MSVYIVGFVISTFLLFYAERKKAKQLERKICVIVGILIPCLIAAFRGNMVGTDVLVYLEPVFKRAVEASSFLNFYNSQIYKGWALVEIRTFEIGYLLLNYLVAKIFKSIVVLQLIIQLLIIVPIYKGLSYFKQSLSIWLGMFIFYMMYYNLSLNLIRQSIAMAFVFFAFKYLIQRKYLNYFMWVLVAFMFHTSAIFGLVILVVFLFLDSKKEFIKKVNMLLILLSGIVLIICFDVFLNILSLLGITAYDGYLLGGNELTILPSQIILRIPVLILLAINWNKFKTSNEFARVYVVVAFLDIILSQLASIKGSAGRVSYYYGMYGMYTYPMICSCIKLRSIRKFQKWYIMSYTFIYWWYQYVYMKYTETIPYVTCF